MSSFVSQSCVWRRGSAFDLFSPSLSSAAPLSEKKREEKKRKNVQQQTVDSAEGGKATMALFLGRTTPNNTAGRARAKCEPRSLRHLPLPPLHPSLLAQPFLGGQAVLPQSHAGATIASPQLQPFHCVMNMSRNKPKNRPVGPAEPPPPHTHPTSAPLSPSPIPAPLRTAAVFVCAHRTVARSPGLRASCGDAVVAPSHRRPVSERGDRRPPSAHRQPRSGQVRSRRREGGKEVEMSPEE